jgi:hypothetical protein
MDVRLEPFLTIEEIAIWARCRDPDVVYLLRTSALDGRHAERNQYLDLRMAHAAMAARAHGRNIERELWEAWGQPTPFSSLIAPHFDPGIEARAEPLTERDLVAKRFALAEAYEKASVPDQRRVADAIDLAAGGRNVSELTAQLPAPLDVLVGHVLATRRGGVNAFGYRAIFPVGDYLLQLLRAGRFKAVGNQPNEILARELSPSDWGGLTIALANDTQRLCVWRFVNGQRVGDGDIENVRVARDDVLKEFPADPPKRPPIEATDEDALRVLRDAMPSRGGFVSQKNGAKIVRNAYPNFNVKKAMQLTKDLTGNTKPGPRGSRRKSSQ